MRPVQIMDKPVAAPNVCIGCGAGVERQFFVDLGIDTKLEKIDEYNHTYFTEGVIYLCSECITSLIVEFNRKLTPFLASQFTARGFLMDANTSEIRTLQDEVFMLRDQLNKRDEEVQLLRFQMLSTFEQENEVLTPPTVPTAEELVDNLLGKDVTDGNSTGNDDANSDGHDPSAAGNDSSDASDNSDSASNEPDSLAATHFQLGSIGATFPPSN